MKPKFIQLVSAPFKTESGFNSVLYGLTDEGMVFKYRSSTQTWLPLGMGVEEEGHTYGSTKRKAATDDDSPF